MIRDGWSQGLSGIRLGRWRRVAWIVAIRRANGTGGGIGGPPSQAVPPAGPAVLVFQDQQAEESEDGRRYEREDDEEDLQARDLSVFSYRHRSQKARSIARTRKARPMPFGVKGSLFVDKKGTTKHLLGIYNKTKCLWVFGGTLVEDSCYQQYHWLRFGICRRKLAFSRC